jgi:anti-sigma factor RsiW
MAEIPGQIDPSEATEAKLCAYLDGELAPDQRTEIEEYLKNYPQHRQTLSDLAAMRNVLRNLPRERAPAEVAEAFQGQMERSMLLDGPADVDSIIRLRRWPQFALAAAIVVLAVGLGIIVYIILPGTPQKYSVAPPIAVAPAPPLSPAIVAEKTPAIVNPPPVNEAAEPSKDLNDQAKLSTAKPSLPPAGNLDTLADVQSASTNRASAVQLGADVQTLDKTVADRLAKAGLASNAANTVCLVVHTGDPGSARKQLQSYFANNGIPYQTIGNADESTGQDGTALSAATKEPLAMKLMATTQPVVTANNAAMIPSSQPVVQAQVQDRDRQLNVSAMQIPVASENPVFIVHSMTRQEAEQLNQALSAQPIGQTAHLYLPSNATNGLTTFAASPATQPTTAPVATAPPTTAPATLAVGDSVTVTVAQLVGPGVDKTNTVRVADNGTISLPMIEPLIAAGQRPADLQGEIAAKYKEANLIPDATVTVFPAATTQPAAPAEAPATQPAEGERVDVVVVVQPNPPTTEPTIPTTAPTGP